MGINGLLPLLKSIHKPCSLKKFAGKTIGVDAYGWLHRGTVSCTMDLVMGNPTRKFVEFCMHRVRMLQHYGVIPFLVFDGDYLPSKAATEDDRDKRREKSKALGMELLTAGKVSQANIEFAKAVDVTPEMARMFIDELKKAGVQYLVAPYEADAQMVYLERKGIISAILSEDSDLLVFGAKCLLTKLDQYGNCIEINQADFCACREINLAGWSEKEFRQMAILSGCDYLASITNMGLKTAYRMIRKYKTVERVLQMLQFDGKYHVPKDYLDKFYQAELTFMHQRVFCPIAEKLVYHTEPQQPLDEEKYTFIGANVEARIARKVATGELNPITKKLIILNNASVATTPSTPWLRSKKSLQETNISESLKSKKSPSIDQFFKAKRTPLAELDINCFTPSPSQQAVLGRNVASWMSVPAPRPYLNRSVSQPEPQPSAPLSAPARAPGRALSGSNFNAEPRPQKRARLCADDPASDSAINSPAFGRSRFFNGSTASPSIGRSKAYRKQQQDVYIHSDDSIEEALLGLPDVGGFEPMRGKTMAVFAEDKVDSGDTSGITGHCSPSIFAGNFTSQISHGSISARTTFLSQEPSLTQSTSFESITDDILRTPTASFEAINDNITAQIRSRFEYNKKERTATPAANTFPTPSSSKISRIPIPIKPEDSISKPALNRSLSTPLQALGAKVLGRSTSNTIPPTPPYTPIDNPKISASTRRISGFAHISKVKPEHPHNKLDDPPFPEVGRIAHKPKLRTSSSLKTVLRPEEIPLPVQDAQEVKMLIGLPHKNNEIGSEDLIVRDSEVESEDEEEVGSLVEQVDLGKFLFKS